MATQQFEAAKKLILHFTQKNCMNPESDIKGVMPGELRSSAPQPHSSRERRPLSQTRGPHGLTKQLPSGM